MLRAWNVVFVCNTESIFLCVSASEAEPPPLLHITTLTTDFNRNHASIVYRFWDIYPVFCRKSPILTHPTGIWPTTLWFIVDYIFQTNAIFSDCHISQGSVAKCLRLGETFKHQFVANLLPSPSVKKVGKSVHIWWSYGQKFGVLFFFNSRCIFETPAPSDCYCFKLCA